jgi:putative spermidine/putrescine transport system substrate-binding protein
MNKAIGVAVGLAAAAAVLLSAGSSMAQETPPKPDTLVVNSSGGAVNKALRKAYFDVFEERHGIRIIDTSPADTSRLRAMVESGNVQWDVTEVPGQDGLLAVKYGLLEPLDHSLIDLSDFPKHVQDSEFLFPRSIYSTVLAYRTDVHADRDHPKGWAEFWDVETFPGRRSLRNHPIDNLEFALLADGVAPEDLYPLDVDRAFAKLDEIKPHIAVWWTSGAQPAQLLVDGEVDLATGWNGRFYDIQKQDAPVAIEWTGGAMKESHFGVPKGAAHPYWSQVFLATMAEPELQAVYANELAYPGLNLRSIEFVDPEVAPHLVTHPDHLDKQFLISLQWWTDNGPDMQERWNRWMLEN